MKKSSIDLAQKVLKHAISKGLKAQKKLGNSDKGVLAGAYLAGLQDALAIVEETTKVAKRVSV